MIETDTLAAIRTAARAAADKKAFAIVGLEISALASYADGLVICSGGSERQVAAIADEVQRRLREDGRRPLHVEGESRAEWVLLDYGDVVIHVFTKNPPIPEVINCTSGSSPMIDKRPAHLVSANAPIKIGGADQ
jgi:ribosome-associated protein